MNLVKKIQSINLEKANLYAFLLHFLSALGLAIYFGVKTGDIQFNTKLYGYDIINYDENTFELTFSEDPNNFKVPGVALKVLVVLIFFITAMFHIFYYKNKTFYLSEIYNGRNRIRWLEYGITSTLMIFVLCVISGVKQYFAVLLICFLNICMLSFGYFLEMSEKLEVKIVCLVLGFFALTGIFGVLFGNFFPNLDAAKRDNYDIPEWVKGVLAPMILWWISFGVVAVLNTRAFGKKNYDFMRYEKYYIILSYLSKAFMGYYLAFGLTRKKAEKS